MQYYAIVGIVVVVKVILIVTCLCARAHRRRQVVVIERSCRPQHQGDRVAIVTRAEPMGISAPSRAPFKRDHPPPAYEPNPSHRDPNVACGPYRQGSGAPGAYPGGPRAYGAYPNDPRASGAYPMDPRASRI